MVRFSLYEYYEKKSKPPKNGRRWLLAIDPDTNDANFVMQQADGFVPDVSGNEDLFPISMISERDDGFLRGGDWLVASTPNEKFHDGMYRHYWVWWNELGEISLDIQRARELLQMGREDFETARQIVKSSEYAASFFFQQASEKHLKAFLCFNHIEIPRTHDIERLIDLCAEIDSDFNNIKDSAIVLKPYSVEIRYSAIKHKVENQIGHVMNSALEIVNFTRKRFKNILPIDMLNFS